MAKIIQDRRLSDRSYLVFRYPQPGGTFLDFHLPFLENPTITETQRPNYSTYDLIGRPGSLFTYLGSKSREFSVTFNITLPHLIHTLATEGLGDRFKPSFKLYYLNKEDQKKIFLSGKAAAAFKTDPSNHFLDFYSHYRNQFIALNPNNDPQDAIRKFENSVSFLLENLNPLKRLNTPFPDQDDKVIKDAVNLVALWIAVVRSSTIGNYTNTAYGPPMIYINHGVMYQGVPCVCQSMNIRANNLLGMELNSLLPISLEVTLTLTENRVGDFGKYRPFKQISGENAAGWEAIINYGTNDPMTNIVWSV